MKRLLLSGIAVVALTGASAKAADYTPPSVYDWTGFYIGVHGGAAWSDVDWTFELSPFDADQSDEGWFAGGQAGVNWQTGALVLGVEGDFSAAWIDGDTSCGVDQCSHEIDWLGSARGRIGWAIDRVLIYGTGGAGFAGVDFNEAAIGLGSIGSASETHFGWVAGGGVEWAFADHWSAKVEYLYYDFGKETFSPGSLDPIEGTNLDTSMHTIKFGVNFKF